MNCKLLQVLTALKDRGLNPAANQKTQVLRVTAACFVTTLFFSCASLQKDIHIDSPQQRQVLELVELERAIVPLEAAGGSEARKQQDKIQAAQRMIAGMEKNAAADADYMGKLTAWTGRLAILEGKYSEARRMYRQSLTTSPWNITSTILGIRLEGDPEKRLELIERELILANPLSAASGFGELQIEKARAFLELRRFSEASGAFDAAFTAAGIDGVYRINYQDARDRAWELRNSGASSESLAILEQGGITWKDCIALAKNETQLLRFLSAGRDTSEAELFGALTDRAFIPHTQDTNLSEWPPARPRENDIVFRSGAAWFIWHLYAQARADRGLLSRYTTRYASGANPRSPIADLPPRSPFFDSVLGCVETELLSLPDGRNFLPGEPVRAAELLTVLKKIDN